LEASLTDAASHALDLGRTRLPPGRHGLPRDFVDESQRQRLLNGVVEAVAEYGYNEATIGRIAAAAKVSRRTFYEHFTDKDDCFLAAYDAIDDHVRAATLGAPGAEAPWPERVRTRLGALLVTLTGDPAVASFYLVEPLSAGGRIAARYRDAMQLLADTLRPDSPPCEADMEVRDQALIGGVTTLIVRRLNAGAIDRLPELLPDLVELVLAPYLGRKEARRIARAA
jgi:AcrR family transcriptional regulator